MQNHGAVMQNYGAVMQNHGTVMQNYGTVMQNHGTMIQKGVQLHPWTGTAIPRQGFYKWRPCKILDSTEC